MFEHSGELKDLKDQKVVSACQAGISRRFGSYIELGPE
jgi:hypothetical protein